MCRTIARLGSCQKYLWIVERWVKSIKRQRRDQTESLVTNLIIHGVYDDCEHALVKAKDIARKNSLHTLDFYPWLLLALKNDHCPFKNNVGAWTLEINMFKNVLWLANQSLSLLRKPRTLLHYVIPVVIIKLQYLRKLKREKRVKFWTFMMGTHPRVGHSCIQQIAGVTPVIQKICHYTSDDYDPDIDTKIEKIKSQLDKLLSLCQLRWLLVEMAQIPKETVSISEKCKACKVGGHCSRDPVTSSWEKQVKHENQIPFALLQKALTSVISPRGLVTLLNSQINV